MPHDFMRKYFIVIQSGHVWDKFRNTEGAYITIFLKPGISPFKTLIQQVNIAKSITFSVLRLLENKQRDWRNVVGEKQIFDREMKANLPPSGRLGLLTASNV